MTLVGIWMYLGSPLDHIDMEVGTSNERVLYSFDSFDRGLYIRPA